ncbi:unnamed protein product [Soboliphyme baturini]|uniref:Choline O-acetyltransferase n=1 Tax=Soboliphyme baturini TaxID=241478 RepID=A0A183ITW1_9BILA|nr:unnamed protein product [Soboliphyme baturini]
MSRFIVPRLLKCPPVIQLRKLLLGGCPHFHFSAKKCDIAAQQLPRVPVPGLRETLDKYLEYVSVISSEEDFVVTRRNVQEFAETEGPALDQQLRAIAANEENWVNQFWIKEMYLGNRLPLPIYSNPGFLLPQQSYASNEEMTRFVALFIHGIYDYKEKIDKRTVPIDLTTGLHKGQLMCMTQYWNLFKSYRKPGLSVDQLETDTNSDLNDNEHIIVMHDNQAYLVLTVVHGQLRSQTEISAELLQILATAKSPQKSGCRAPVGAYTSVDRNKAYRAYQMLLKCSRNRLSLDMIKSSSFVVCLDKATGYATSSERTPSATTSRNLSYMILGGGCDRSSCNRWYDKTLQFIFTRDGLCGINYEHTVAEGIPLIHLAEHVIHYIEKYKPVAGKQPPAVTSPQFLEWLINPELQHLLEECCKDIDKLANSLDVEVLCFRKYGKNFIKQMCISPDAFVQLALQLTYYRCYGRLTSTYESGTLRRFIKGRVENIRAATPEAFEWVKVMDSKDVSQDVKHKAFKNAVKKQTSVMEEATSGYGIDNYLVALRELASRNLIEQPKIFTDKNFDKSFRFPLSTSQVNTSIASVVVGYGPVVDDGYGCGYRMQPEEIFFVISSSRNCQLTSSLTFQKTLEKTLLDLRNFTRDMQ